MHWSLKLMLLFVVSVPNQAFTETSQDPVTLTAYGEPCSDACIQRGFPYTWCHKKPSRNGTWIDRDYCSQSPGVTRYQEPCLNECRKRERPFFWCNTLPTQRGDWDYCSPFSLDSCAWSAWGTWSACSATCGSKSTRARRRRMESGDGRVRHCSGEIEQSIRSCRMAECPQVQDESDCEWSEWSDWSPCSVSCGSGGSQSRLRKHVQESGINGSPCGGQDEQVISCNSDPCDELIEDGETTTFSANPEQVHLGSLRNYHHGISGEVYRLGQRRLRIEDFHYDGLGPDAFIWIGTETPKPGDNGTLLPYPFTGEFYHYTDPEAPVLGRFDSETLDLTLPPQIEASDIQWVSIWCRKFRVNFGDLILSNEQEEREEEEQQHQEQKHQVQASSRPNIFDPRLRTTSPSSVISISTTARFNGFSRPTLNPNLPELPRRINSQKRPPFGQLFKSKKDENQKGSNEVEGKDPVPFTVIRVSSSVSQVRQESNELDDDEQIALPFIVETTTSENESGKSVVSEATSSTFTTIASTSEDPTATSSTTPTSSEKTTSKRLFGPRKPFLRPVAKFQDIKIPSLEPNNGNKADAPLRFRTIGDKRTSFKRPTLAPVTSSSTSDVTESSTSRFSRVPIRNTVSFLVRNATTFSVVTKASFGDSGESSTTVTPISSSSEPSPTTSISSDEFRSSTLVTPEREISSSTTERSISRSSITANEFRPTVKSAESAPAIVETTTISRGISTTQEVVTSSEEEEEDESATPPSETALPFNGEDDTVPDVQTSTTDTTTTTSTPITTTTTANQFNRRITLKPFGRDRSRFKGLDTIKRLLEKRKQFLNKVRGSTTPSSITKSVNRFRTTLKKVAEQTLETSEEENEQEEEIEEQDKKAEEGPPLTVSRRPLISRLRPTARPEQSTFSTSVRVSRFRTTRAPFEVETITKVVPDSASTVRISDNERLRIVTDFMKKDKEEVLENQVPAPEDKNDVNQFKEESRTISDPSEKRKGVVVKVPKKIDWNPVKTAAAAASLNELDEDDEKNTKIKVISTEPLFITPPPPGTINDDGTSYNPCSITDACGPNADCTPRRNEPLCTCPRGFSGIPRDGIPDPAHGCVRTPEKCTVKDDVDSCSEDQSCVRELCLPRCELDTECSLGERCVNGNCIKICFYDAHCLAGEFCEKSGLNSTNGICLAGCQRDTNCPFGQICVSDDLRGKRCEAGCHFNNDCGMNHACINGSCGDPCANFDECGSNALCEVINHVATCKCPPAFRELNSPYVACVPNALDLSKINCLKDTDCESGEACRDWQCESS